MLRSMKSIQELDIKAHDGDMGTARDLYIDDSSWIVRYLVVDTRKWLPGRKVLVSPISVRNISDDDGKIELGLTKEDLKESPSIEQDEPVHREMEKKLTEHFSSWPQYWSIGDMRAEPVGLGASKEAAAVETPDSQLRSLDEVAGYQIAANDDEIGQLEDFVVDDSGWQIRYLVVDTGNLLPGRKVLVSPQWVDDISWRKGRVRVGLSRRQVEQSPVYDPSQPLTRDYEKALHEHYEMAKYW